MAASSTATGAYPALTTLFEQPTGCQSLFKVANVSRTPVDLDDAYTSYSYYVSNTADPKYSSCQPSGWNEHNFTFSPAVCPSGWIYYAGKEETPDSGKPYSRAFCCAIGFEYSPRTNTPGLPDQQCMSITTVNAVTSASASISTGDATVKVYIHEAFAAQWHKSETSKFPFAVPDLSWPTYLNTWTPGSTLSDFEAGSGETGLGGKGVSDGIIAAIVVCTVVGVAILVGIVIWVRRANRRKVSSRTAAQQGTELTEKGGKTGSK